jgi:cytidylate kinase
VARAEARVPADGDPAALVALVPEIELVPDANGRLAHVSVDGEDVTADVHTPRVDEAVSAVSRVAELRAALLDVQRALAAEPGGIVMAGRDIGTVVLPDADLKIFLDASVEERARRRTEERGLDADSPEARFILAQLRRRDDLDQNRAVAPLRPAEDAVHIVTDGNQFEETVAAVVAAIREAEDEGRGRRGDALMADAANDAAKDARPAAKPAIDEEELLRSDITPLITGTALGARFLARGITRVRVEGAIDAIPREGPVILASNHISNADAVIIGAWLTPTLGRRIHWLGKREMFDWPVVGWMARNGGIVPVDRARPTSRRSGSPSGSCRRARS